MDLDSGEKGQNQSVRILHEEVLKRCLRGDENAQLQIYSLYYKAMYNTARRIVGDPVESEDVMQEAFITAFAQLQSLRELSTFSAWLKRIVVNKAINAAKHRMTFLGIDEIGIADESVEESSEYTIEMIRSSIDKLPNGYRVILSLYLLEGYDHEEISDVLKISPSTSRSQYARARRRLQQLLKPAL